MSDLLDLSRITAGKLEVIRSPVDLVKIAQAAVDAMQRRSPSSAGCALTLEQPEPRLFVLGDEQRLIQSVANLTGNGIKFTRAGGSVVVRVERLDGNAVVTVSDTGIGMTPAVLERLFETFWQADSSKAREHGGLGLGLAITKHLIDEHDGTIEAASAGPGLGSTFTIKLPLLDVGWIGKDVPAVRRKGTKDLDRGPRPARRRRPGRTGTRRRSCCRRAARKVDVAGSVQAAIDFYDSEPPSVVVSDIGMPDEDGYSLAAR